MRSACDVYLDNAYLYTGRSCWVCERVLRVYLCALFLVPICRLPLIIYFINL